MTRRAIEAGDAAANPRPLGFRGGGFVARPRPLAAWAALIGAILLWQAASTVGLVSPVFLPSPDSVARALWRLALSGKLADHLEASLVRILGGWVIGTLAGLAAGTAIGVFSLARAAGLPIVSALFPIPKIALLPLFILWFGIGEPAKLATIALGVFFPTVIATASGIDQVPRSLIRMAQSFNLPGHAILRTIVLPGALPGILSGFRISASIALILVVAAEMIGAERGIGAFILTAGNLMQTDQLLAGVVVLSLLGLGVGALLSAAERWLLRWR
ncbi:MAG: ABC transporter permease [Proteobacteria bacterium]|nr:ABC transporter permease [Pseudomonadota bacterium]MBI3497053.1 ABC transporter permease [Pseudomonadota bacterium]